MYKKQMGRPKSEEPKDFLLKIRMSKAQYDKFEAFADGKFISALARDILLDAAENTKQTGGTGPKRLGRYPEVGEKFWLEVACSVDKDADGDFAVWPVGYKCSGNVWLGPESLFDDATLAELEAARENVRQIERRLGLKP